MKDLSALFENIPDNIYEIAFRRLQELRAEYPSYRDDQLLMFELCDAIVAVAKFGEEELDLPSEELLRGL